MTSALAVAVRNIKSAMELTSNFVQAIQDVVLQPDLSSAVVLFVVSLVNELISVLPYTVVLSGQLVFLNSHLSLAVFTHLFVFVAIPVGLGSAVGTLPVYALAYFGGKPAIDKFQKYLRFSWEDVEKVNLRFRGAWYDDIVFIALRCIPLLPYLPVNAAAGILRMRLVPYLILTAIGATIRMMIMFMFVGLGIETLAQ